MSFRPSSDLVRTILSKATAFDWSWQGLGMFRLMLSREVRMHVWIPKSAVPHVTTIHSHPWDFESKIICGAMINRCYRKLTTAELRTRHKLGLETQWFTEQEIICGPGGGMKPESKPDQVPLLHIGDLLLDSGGSYHMKHNEIHESIPETGTVSIIKREFRENTEDAFVYHQIKDEWVSAIPRPATADEVEAMAKVALARLAREELRYDQ